MLAGYKRKTNIGIGGGFLTCMLGVGFASAAADGSAVLAALTLICIFGGLGLFVYGCCVNAKGKGYPTFLGALGLLGLIGLIVLAVLPDQRKCCDTGGPDCTHGRGPTRGTGDRWSSRAA